MKTPTDNLYLLIKSLSKSEKIYFKKFSRLHETHGVKNYIRLFDEIEKQAGNEKYDESKIKKIFEGEAFIKQLHVAKNYLYSLILKSLRSQYAGASVLHKLNEGILNLDVLYHKGMFKACLAMTKQLKKEAYMRENHIELLNILRYESFASRKNLNVKKPGIEDMAENEFSRVVKIIDNKNKLDKYSLAIFRLYTRQERLTAKDEILLEKIISDPVFKSPDNALSYDAKMSYYFCLSNYYQIKNKIPEDYAIQKEHISFMESRADMLSLKLGRYAMLLNNFLINCLHVKKIDDFMLHLDKVKQLAEKFKGGLKQRDSEALLFRIYYTHLLNIAVQKNDFGDIEDISQKVTEGLKIYEPFLGKAYTAVMYWSLARFYFHEGRFEDALRWNNTALNEKSNEKLAALYCMGIVFNLIIHYELKNFDLLEYQYVSTLNYLKKRGHYYKYASALVYFMKNFNENLTFSERQKIYKETISRINKLKDDTSENNITFYFNIPAWLESKATGEPLKSICLKIFNRVYMQKPVKPSRKAS